MALRPNCRRLPLEHLESRLMFVGGFGAEVSRGATEVYYWPTERPDLDAGRVRSFVISHEARAQCVASTERGQQRDERASEPTEARITDTLGFRGARDHLSSLLRIFGQSRTLYPSITAAPGQNARRASDRDRLHAQPDPLTQASEVRSIE